MVKRKGGDQDPFPEKCLQYDCQCIHTLPPSGITVCGAGMTHSLPGLADGPILNCCYLGPLPEGKTPHTLNPTLSSFLNSTWSSPTCTLTLCSAWTMPWSLGFPLSEVTKVEYYFVKWTMICLVVFAGPVPKVCHWPLWCSPSFVGRRGALGSWRSNMAGS